MEVWKKLFEKIRPKAELVDLPGRHVAGRFTSCLFVFAAVLTVVLPSERPELRCNSTRTRSWPGVQFPRSTGDYDSAFVWIWRFCYPREFSSNRIETQAASWHGFQINFLSRFYQSLFENLATAIPTLRRLFKDV